MKAIVSGTLEVQERRVSTAPESLSSLPCAGLRDVDVDGAAVNGSATYESHSHQGQKQMREAYILTSTLNLPYTNLKGPVKGPST